jgi:hypothetical protein
MYIVCMYVSRSVFVCLLGNLLIRSDLDALKHSASNTAGVDFNNSVSVDNNTAVSDRDIVDATSGHAVKADGDVETETGTRELEVNASSGSSETPQDPPGSDRRSVSVCSLLTRTCKAGFQAPQANEHN